MFGVPVNHREFFNFLHCSLLWSTISAGRLRRSDFPRGSSNNRNIVTLSDFGSHSHPDDLQTETYHVTNVTYHVTYLTNLNQPCNMSLFQQLPPGFPRCTRKPSDGDKMLQHVLQSYRSFRVQSHLPILILHQLHQLLGFLPSSQRNKWWFLVVPVGCSN